MTQDTQPVQMSEDAGRILESLLFVSKVDQKLTGRAYLRGMVERIAQTLGCSHVFVGRAQPANRSRIETLEMWVHGASAPNLIYDLDGTPCTDVFTGQRVCLYEDGVAEAFPMDVMLAEEGIRSYAGAPLVSPTGELSGLLVALDTKPCKDPALVQVLLDFFAGRAAAELDRQESEDAMRSVQAELERRVEERTRALTEAQSRMLELARRSGMADVATSVLHNVGNLLTAAETAVGEMERLIGARSRDVWRRAAGLLAEHEGDLVGFLTGDRRGQRLPELFKEASRVMDAEAERLAHEASTLHRSLDLIAAVVASQQDYARGLDQPVVLDAAEVVGEVVAMFGHRFTRHGIRVVCEVPEMQVLAVRVKLFQVLSNLIRNAIDFTQHASTREVRITSPAPRILKVADTGSGVAPEHQPKLFALGFSTRAKGNGVGLHSASVLAQEMGASLAFGGNDPGASFVLTFGDDAGGCT